MFNYQLFHMIKLPLPEGVVAHFTSSVVEERVLYPEELELCVDFEPKRMLDFCRGRYCAHKCLEMLGYQQPVLKSCEGMPLLPYGITGSISHSLNMAGCIMGSKDQYLSIGVDVEAIGRISPELWQVLFTPGEIDCIRRQPIHTWDKMSTLFYTVKEAYYKMQFPITMVGMEYDDLRVVYQGGNVSVKVRNEHPSAKLTNDIMIQFADNQGVIVSCVLMLK